MMLGIESESCAAGDKATRAGGRHVCRHCAQNNMRESLTSLKEPVVLSLFTAYSHSGDGTMKLSEKKHSIVGIMLGLFILALEGYKWKTQGPHPGDYIIVFCMLVYVGCHLFLILKGNSY